MAEVTVAQFAETLKVGVDKLLTQLDEAGIKVSGAEDRITDDAKLELLSYLRRSHGRAEPEVAAPKKITLKRKSHTELRVAADKGRARTVNVEVRTKRTYVKREALEEEAREKQDELDQQRRAEQDTINAVERAEQERREAEERAQREAEDEVRRLAEEEEARRRAADDEARRTLAEQQAREQTERERDKERRKKEAEREGRGRGTAKEARTLHVAGDKAGKRRKRKQAPDRGRASRFNVETQHGFERPTAPVVREVAIPETISVAELAQRMAVKGPEVIKILMNMGAMVTINQSIDQDTAVLVVEEMGHTPKLMRETEIEDSMLDDVAIATDAKQVPRSPVVTIMGHVDHGKTSLLDYIRSTRVASGEAGGITQHVGAYSVSTPKGKVTFLDTPGHAAFTAMRARGAQVTDIVVLVVAANDGVMPQTVEAVQHSKAAGVPIIVAVNKIDLEDADPERVKSGLSQHGVISEDWGGENLFVSVSAKTGVGIDELLDAILLQAEVLDLQAPGEGPARGVVVEASLEKGRGAVATVLVQGGRLKVGDVLLAGRETGRVRAMFDEAGQSVREAGPSTPVVVLGLSGTPSAGDEVLVVDDERKAREVAEYRQGKQRDVKLAQQQAGKLEDVFSQMAAGEAASVQLMIKADVHGSAEALRDAMTRMSSEEVRVKVIASGVGGITESDVNLAAASQAIVIGFNVRADAAARQAIKDSGVDVRYYSIIYEAIDDVKAAISGLMLPEIRENIVGLAQVREVFNSPKYGDIAGSMVLEGYVRRANPIRVLRDNVVIYEGALESLRRFKDDVNEVRAGTECGIGVRNYNDVRPGDQIECFERFEVERNYK
jgi:translation initiation factor IF-2